jgi:hypothetical protein
VRFVPIKSIEQQAILSVRRVRQGFVKARSAQANQIRGLLGEFGLIIPKGLINVAKRVPEILEDAGNELPVPFRHLIDRLTEHLKELDRQVKEFEREIIAWHRSSELSRKLEKIPGIGPLAASALVASIADAHSFDNGRQVSAWLDLVPRQSSSGSSRIPSRNFATQRQAQKVRPPNVRPSRAGSVMVSCSDFTGSRRTGASGNIAAYDDPGLPQAAGVPGESRGLGRRRGDTHCRRSLPQAVVGPLRPLCDRRSAGRRQLALGTPTAAGAVPAL